jgi:hypothetical protein
LVPVEAGEKAGSSCLASKEAEAEGAAVERAEAGSSSPVSFPLSLFFFSVSLATFKDPLSFLSPALSLFLSPLSHRARPFPEPPFCEKRDSTPLSLSVPGQGSRPGRGGGPGGGPGGGTAPGRGGGPADSPSVFGAPPPPPPGASPIGVMLDAPSAANFRPPPGFMEEGAEASWILGADGGLGSSPGAEPFDVETALSMVRARARPWHQLAGLLRSLQAAGLDAMAVEVETGLERATQALWQTAAQVYASLKSDAVFPSEAMPAFDSPPGAPALHELRNLPADARRGAAEYLATGGEMLACGNGILEQVDADLASTLARAYREYERRPREREGFSDAPGDVLAYKHWRDAAECRREEDKEKALRKGLAVAVSAAAKERFESLSTEAIARVVPAAEAAAAAAAAGLLKMSAGGVRVRFFVVLSGGVGSRCVLGGFSTKNSSFSS